MNIALWIVQVLLAALFGLAGFLHGYQIERAKAQLPWARDMPVAWLRFVGTSEILGALGMILPMATHLLAWLTPLAGIGLAVIQFLAMFTVHIPRKEYAAIPVNSVLLMLSLFVVIGRWPFFSLIQ
jgi:uncharacterized membrane protein YphA (DoxX/SURF4 family)